MGLDVNVAPTFKGKMSSVYAIKPYVRARDRHFAQVAESICSLLLFGTREVDRHSTTRVTDVLLSAARACSNCGIENVPSDSRHDV